MELKKEDLLRNKPRKEIRMSIEEQKLMALGDDAEQLLATDAFNRVVDSMVEATFQTFVNTQYPEKEKRETAHAHYKALVDIIETLRQRVSVRDEISAKLEQINTADESDNSEQGRKDH